MRWVAGAAEAKRAAAWRCTRRARPSIAPWRSTLRGVSGFGTTRVREPGDGPKDGMESTLPRARRNLR
jgi:hypothetical protein